MRITNVKTNHVTNPMGFFMDSPTISWIVTDTTAKKQKCAQVIIALDNVFKNIVADSGALEEVNSLGYSPDLTLAPMTRYYIKVRVWGDNGEMAENSENWFETGKNADWQAKWIGATDENKDSNILVRGTFELPSEVLSARAYVCGVGLYEMEINNVRVGCERLTPFYNSYNKWLQYQTYDITKYLVIGGNAVGASLGNGWYKGRLGFEDGHFNLYGDTQAFIAELHITLKSGETRVIHTDEGWHYRTSAVIDSNIYDGEVYDANLETEGWSCYDCCTDGWEDVAVNQDIGCDRLQARRSLPLIVKETIKPVSIIKTPKGETVLDMGQIITGWVKFNVDVPSGTRVKLSFGEVMQNESFYRDNLRTAKAEYTYISNGKPCKCEPKFTYYGFRFVKVEGIENININDFIGCVVYSDIEVRGNIETSNSLVNRLFKNAVWGQKGNFLDVPTDCPQRDERLGWTGDAQVFSGTAQFNMDCYAFYSKYLYDLLREQEDFGGSVPYIVPSKPVDGHGSSAWGDAATIIPWNVYLHTGDVSILKQQFESMKAWVDYIKTCDEQAGGGRLWNTGFSFGDWLALDGPNAQSPMGGTAVDFISSAFYAYSTDNVVKAARVLGKHDIAEEYQRLANEVRAAIIDEYFTANGRLAINTQTACVLALFMNLGRESQRSRIAEQLRMLLEAKSNHLQTGFVGTPYICRVLSENGMNKEAYDLLLNEDYPSWLYEVKLGATTIWERWNSLNPDGTITGTDMNSLNHYAYGSIAEWMYRNMCGINPVESTPGFRRARIAPQPDARIQWARAELMSAAGLYKTSWKINNDDSTVTIEIQVPFGCTAEVVLPGREDDVLELDAGTYTFLTKSK